MTTQIRFQPTLFVYVGTSAGQIGWRVKKLLHHAYGDVPVLRHLWIDIDTDIASEARPWFTPAERVELSGFNPAAVVHNLQHYPQIKEWWPGASTPAGMLAGAGSPQQMRLIARLALFRMFSDRTRGEAFIDKLNSATDALFQIANIEATEAKTTAAQRYTVEPGSRVVMVFSVCGGTGSAIAFDIAYLCRSLLAGKAPAIIAISTLPPVVDKAIRSETQIQKDKIRANAYAWFKEENALTCKPYWNVQYPDGGVVEVAAPPFDYRFIVDIENQAGYRLNAADDVYNMIAQSIYMDTGSSIAGAKRGFTGNVSTGGEVFEGMRRSFNSLSAASLIFPKERLLQYCAERLSADLLKEGLLRAPDPHQVEAGAAALLAQLHLRDGDLLGALTSQHALKLAYEPSILKADSVAAAAGQIDAQEGQNQTARRTALETMRQTVEEQIDLFAAQLDAEIARAAGLGGLRYAAAVVDALLSPAPAGQVGPEVTSLEGLQARILQQGCTESDLAAAKATYEKSRAALKSLDDGIEDALERMVSMKGWLRKFSLFKRDCLSAMTQGNDLTVQYAAQQQASAVYDRLADLLKHAKVHLLAASATLERMAEENTQAARLLAGKTADRAGQYEFLQEIALDFDAYYHKHAAQINLESAFPVMSPSRALKSPAVLEEWASGDAREDIRHYAEGFFAAQLEATSLLRALEEQAVLQGKAPAVLVEEYMNRLVTYCHPFWKYDQDSGLNDTEGKSIIGVEDADHPLIPESFRNGLLYEIKTTGFRDRIDVARIRHGLPAFLIRGMREWKAIYETKRKGIDPLHVLPGMEFEPDLLPEQSAKNRDMFAAALAFGYIVQVGSWYYYDPEKAYSTDGIQPGKEYRLAQGREKAEESFVRREEWVRAVADNIESEVRQIGNTAAIHKLDSVIEAYKSDIARMKTTDEVMRKQYEKEMRALVTMQRLYGKVG